MLTVPTPEVETQRLAALRALGVLDTPPEPELDVITALAADRFDAPISLLSLVDENRQWFKSRVGLDVAETDRTVSFCGYTILSDDVFVVPDALADDRFRENPLVIGGPQIRFYAAAPLVLSGGERVGTLCVIDSRPRNGFSDRDARALKLLAGQATAHLEARRMRAEQRITQLIADTTSDAFVCADASGHIIYWNRGAETTFGYSAHDAIGQSLEIIVPPEHHGAHGDGIKRLHNGGVPRLVGRPIEVPAVRRDGSRLMTELTLGMWHEGDSQVPAGYASIIRDASQRILTETKLAEQIAAIEAAQEGIAIADADGVHHYMNEAFLRMFGLPENTHGIPWTHLFAPHDRARLAAEAFAKDSDDGRWFGEVDALRSDGRLLRVELSLTQCGESVVSVVRDITLRREADRDRDRLREQLLVAQRQEAVGQLASGLAHDFNNLIAAIAGSAALIRDGADGEAVRHAARIASAADSATSLVDKMLSLGQRKPDNQAHDLRSIVVDAAELLDVSLSENQRLDLDLDHNPVTVQADRTELMQVLLNLCLNARDAMVAGRIGISVRLVEDAAGQVPGEARALNVGVMPTGAAAHISVVDDGCGIAPTEMGHIFRPFYSRKDNAGTGLGLAMVAGIVQAAGAGLSVWSQVGEGTRFDIFWPLTPPVADPAFAATANDYEGPSLLDGITVLVVDDDPAVLETLAQMLERVGAEVAPCQDPHDALTALQEDPDAWTVLVTDFDMPVMNGAALARQARTICPDLPILLVTALPEEPRMGARYDDLFDGVSGKRVSVSGLASAVHATIAKRRKRVLA